jgi:hypothetical protein
MMAMRFVAQAGMSKRLCQEQWIPKFIADAFFERTHASEC